METAKSETPPEPKVFRLPLLGWPRVRSWKELRRAGFGRHLFADLKRRNVDQDQGIVARAALYANKSAVAKGTLGFVDPSGPGLDQSDFQRRRSVLLKLIWKAVKRVERAAPGKIFWFWVTVVSPENLVVADDITAERLKNIRRWHGRRFRKMPGGVFAAGFVDISRNEERDGAGLFSVHEHVLVGICCQSEAEGRAAIHRAYVVSNPDKIVDQPLWVRRTTARGLGDPRKHAIGALVYATRSSKIGLIMRRETFTGKDGKQKTIDRGMTVKQRAELLPALSRLSFNDRVITAGARRIGVRLEVRWLLDRKPCPGYTPRPTDPGASVARQAAMAHEYIPHDKCGDLAAIGLQSSRDGVTA